jgi:hypothetical protein
MRFSLKLSSIIKCSLLAFFLLIYVNSTISQSVDNKTANIYKYNYMIETPLTAGMFLASYYGFDQLKKKKRLSLSTINNLNADNVWFIDRSALKQDPSFRLKAHDLSDLGLNITCVLPGILAFDDKIRKEWAHLIFIYLEAQATSNMIYSWGPPQLTKRIRPLVYYEDVTMEEKLGSGTTDAFFSGHVATTATASFFMAKVYTDFHPELARKKWLIYGAALIPPTFVAIMRYKALKHFPTDLMVGMAVGACIGILIPELHKVKSERKLSLMPIAGMVNGLRLNYQFKYK